MSVLWKNSLGEPVDLDTINRVYVARKARQGWLNEDFREDELTQELRDVILNGRVRDGGDSLREAAYNKRNAARGLTFRVTR